jgi:TIR domain
LEFPKGQKDMAKKTRGIFVSYRRGDTAGYAGRLTDRLDEHFGEQRVFHDVDSIKPGLDFVEAIQKAIGSSEVLLAVIGRNWATATDAAGQKRLQDPQDYLRMEIITALQRNIRVIPVLVQGASMPSAQELPNDLAPLARRNGFELRETSWGSDVQRLITTLEEAVGDRRPQPRQPTRDKKARGVAPRSSGTKHFWVDFNIVEKTAAVIVFILLGLLVVVLVSLAVISY